MQQLRLSALLQTARWTKCYTSHLCSITLINLVSLINPVMEALNAAQRLTILTDASTYVSAVVWMTYQFFWDVTPRSCIFGSWHFETLWWSHLQGSNGPKVLHGCFDPHDETITASQNVGKHMHSDAVSLSRRTGTSSWLMVFVVFIISSRQMWGQYFKSGDSYVCLHIFQFTMRWSFYYSTLYRLNYWQHC